MKQCGACILFACINGFCEEYKADKTDLNSYLLWFLRYDFHKFVPVHGIDEDEACSECILLAYINGSCEEHKADKKDFNFYLLWFLRYDCHKFVPEHALMIIDDQQDESATSLEDH